MRQHTQRNVLETIPILQKVRQNVIADLVDVFSMHMADHIQVWRINDYFATEGDGRFKLVHGLSGGPEFVVHLGCAGKHTLKGLLAPVNMALRR